MTLHPVSRQLLGGLQRAFGMGVTRRLMRGAFRTVALTFIVTVATSGCSFHVSAGAVNDLKFREAWQTGWNAVDTASRPLNPTASNPGACNQGGSAADCMRTGETMIPVLHSLATALAGVETPSSYRAASQEIQSAIALDIQAITDRDAAIKTNDETLFAKAVGELKSAAQAFVDGYGKFPQSTRPTPVPFSGRLSG